MKSEALLKEIGRHGAECDKTHKQLSDMEGKYSKQNKQVKEIIAFKNAIGK